MLTHVVLFRPRVDLSAADTARLIEAFNQAIVGIDSVRRARIGRRTSVGAQYEQLPQPDLTYIALIEFDDAGGLTDYLNHPAHVEIGRRFFESSDAQLIYDFELGEAGVVSGTAPAV